MRATPPIPWQVRHEGRTLLLVHIDPDEDGVPATVTYREESGITLHTTTAAEWSRWAKEGK